MLVSPLPPPLLDTYRLFMLSLRCRYLTDFSPSQKAIEGHFSVGSRAHIETHVLIISRMVHRHQFNCLLIHLSKSVSCRFKEWSRVSYKDNCPRVYFTDGISAAELRFEKFPNFSEVFFSCFFPLRYFMVSVSNTPKHLQFFFSPRVLILFWFGGSIPSVICLFPVFLMSIAHFSMPHSIPLFWLYIPIVCIKLSHSFSFFAKSLIPSM